MVIPLPPRPPRPPLPGPVDAASAQALSTPVAQQQDRDARAVTYLRNCADDIRSAARRGYHPDLTVPDRLLVSTVAQHAAALGYQVTVYLDAWTDRPNGRIVLNWHPNGPGPGIDRVRDTRGIFNVLRGLLRRR